MFIGLDPAGPGFSQGNKAGRLDPSDARYVEAVHTCPGLLGANFNVGHSDFFANNGKNQPGCGADPVGKFCYFTGLVLKKVLGTIGCYMRFCLIAIMAIDASSVSCSKMLSTGPRIAIRIG